MITRPALLASVAPVAFDNGPPLPGEGGSLGFMPTTPEAVRAAKAFHGKDPVSGDAMLRRSTDSAAMLDYWDLTDTIVDGVDAMRLAGEKYMPRFADEEQRDYDYRLSCVKMTNVYRDAVEGLASKPFEQEVSLAKDDDKDAPEPVVDFVEDVDGSGNNLTVFASQTFFSGINSAIHWIFVDHPPVNPNVRSQADAKATGARPYWSHVLGRNVLAATSKVINGKETLTYIRIFEPGAVDHVRVFIRDDNGNVRWELYGKTNEWREIESGKTQFHQLDGADGGGIVTIGRIPLVPFMTGRRDGRTFRLFPAMRDAADLQKNLYQSESGLEFAKKLTAYPMLAGNGVKPPLRVLYAPPDNSGASGSWAYVEPSASSLKFLSDDIEATIKQLRELGRQPLVATMSITTIQAGQAASKAKSAVGAWALGLKDSLENAMVLTCLFMGIKPETYDPTVSVYTDFDQFTEGKDLEALAGARAAKDISRQTYWGELKRRRVLSDEFDPDEEEKRLLDETPGDGEDTEDIDAPPPTDPNALLAQ
jgi:hypothetical protein